MSLTRELVRQIRHKPVGDDERRPRSRRVERPSKTTYATASVASAIVAISTGRNASVRSWLLGTDSSAAAGATNTATCAEDEIAISLASFVRPRRATTIAPPCSAALPTIATITTAMKNSDQPSA